MMSERGVDVIIAGGGLAGLAAAKRLVDAGLRVDLYEKRPLLGGKVSSWKDADGDWIETGLHVFFGAYEEIYDLMRELGIYDNILWKEHVLTYTLDEGERFEFRTLPLPSPAHLLPAVFQNRYFGWGDKLSLLRALYPMLFGGEALRGFSFILVIGVLVGTYSSIVVSAPGCRANRVSASRPTT